MKVLFYFFFVLTIVSCQKESLVVIDNTPNENFVIDSELSGLMTSVAAHDGTFDDILDNAGCFSVVFPYTIIYNGETRVINSVNDLLGIKMGQEITFQYPFNITFANYVSRTINNLDDLNDATASCATNQTFLNSIRCVDFVYPIRLATYNNATNRFSTLIIDHDQQNFQTISALLNEQLTEIRFPVMLTLANGELLQIESSEVLKDIIYLNADSCE